MGLTSTPEMAYKDKDTSIDVLEVFCDNVCINSFETNEEPVRNILDFNGKLIKRVALPKIIKLRK